MSSADRLYTPDLLALTLRLADYPWNDALPLSGEARSRSCGSTLAMGLLLDQGGHIDGIGLRTRACAVGQASAAIFAAAAKGKTLEEIEASAKAMEDWLAGNAPLPDWPGLGAIEA
ncbi:MAG TPA: iron-sulfur cluster assembly scaffold protein, partial [Sphingomonadaceae bacterium]|nr:iron-sulfur cluster assembly scaffold protein [Sphingomonadaceae bacterium]